jgi:hypothetical protein
MNSETGIFRPVRDLIHSQLLDTSLPSFAVAVARDGYGRDGSPLPFYDFDHPGASAVFCSAHDLVRFGMFHLKAHLPDQKAILPDGTIDEMQQPTMASRQGAGYGIGWGIAEDEHGYRTVAHSGGMGGVSTILVLVPAEELAVVALANASSGLPERVAREVLSALLPEYAARRAHAEAEQEQKAEESAAQAPAFHPPAELLGKWTGTAHTGMRPRGVGKLGSLPYPPGCGIMRSQHCLPGAGRASGTARSRRWKAWRTASPLSA